MIKKKELIIILSIIAACVLSLLLFLPRKIGKTVIVRQNDAVICQKPLGIDKTIALDCCKIKIENGAVFMEESSCSNKICVNTGKIAKANEQIICLPNRVIIEVTADEN